VAATKRANSALVTSVRSIQKPSTCTRWMGRASGPSRGSSAPIENSPPGIHTIPAGAGPGGVEASSTVGANPAGVPWHPTIISNATARIAAA
jgi:hypothetical protein